MPATKFGQKYAPISFFRIKFSSPHASKNDFGIYCAFHLANIDIVKRKTLNYAALVFCIEFRCHLSSVHVGMCMHINPTQTCWSDYLQRPLIPDNNLRVIPDFQVIIPARQGREFLQNWPQARFQVGRSPKLPPPFTNHLLQPQFQKILMEHSNWINIASQSITWTLHHRCHIHQKIIFFRFQMF